MLESPIKRRKLSHYLVCHFAELPLKEKGPGLNSTHAVHIPLDFGFDRQVANLAAPPQLRENETLSTPTLQSRGLVAIVYSLTKQRDLGLGLASTGKPHQAVSGKEGPPPSLPFPSAEVTSPQSINGLQSAAGESI